MTPSEHSRAVFLEAMSWAKRHFVEILLASAREFQLLQYFVEHPGVTLSRELLLKEVWAYGTHVYTRTLDVHVANLRQKIENNPKYPALILTVPRLGYKFVP